MQGAIRSVFVGNEQDSVREMIIPKKWFQGLWTDFRYIGPELLKVDLS